MKDQAPEKLRNLARGILSPTYSEGLIRHCVCFGLHQELIEALTGLTCRILDGSDFKGTATQWADQMAKAHDQLKIRGNYGPAEQLSALSGLLRVRRNPLSAQLVGRGVEDHEAETVTLPRAELLNMLDIADEMVRFCSVNMPDEQYNASASAIWVIANRAAGRHEDADELLGKLMSARAVTEQGNVTPTAGHGNDPQ